VGSVLPVVYVSAVLVGRATRPDGAPLAVVWPAAAVGVAWLAWAGVRGRRAVLVAAASIAVLAAAVNAATGAAWPWALLLGASGAVQAVVSCAVLRRGHARRGTPPWRLRTVDDLTVLLTAAYAGGAAAALVGMAGTHPASPGVGVLTFVAWVLRVGTSTFVFAAAGLRVLDRGAPATAVPGRRLREVVALVATTTVAYAFVFTAPVQLPLAFTVVPLALWVALRFPTTAAALHVVPAGVFVVAATLAHRGPFGTAPEALATTLLTQAFITVIGITTLVMALNRDERARLVGEVRAAHLHAQQQAEAAREQAQLFASVLAEMEEGIAVVDGDGRFVLRNRAAGELLQGFRTPDAQEPDPGDQDPTDPDPTQLGLHLPDGTPCPREQRADRRALAGDDVDQDYLVRLPDGGERVLATRASVLTTDDGHRRALLVFSDVTAVRRAAAEVARARDLFSGVLDAATELAIVSTDVQGLVTVFNTGAERLLGHPAEDVIGRTPWFLHDPADLAEQLAGSGVDLSELLSGRPLAPATSAALAELSLGTRRWVLRTRDGRPVPVMTTTSLMRTGEDGAAVTGRMSASRDLSAELAARADLADSEERFRLAFDTAPTGMMMLALSGERPGTIMQANPAMTDLLGHDQLDLLGTCVADLTHPDDLGATEDLLRRHRSGELAQARTEERWRHRDGSTVWIRLSTAVVHPHDWEPYALALIEDVTARKRAEEALTHQALHDALTGLPNRTLFADRLEHAVAAAERSGRRVGVLYLDLDGFKAVNDTAGHAAGDELLQQVAARIGACVRPGDTLARLGGDEFALVCPDLLPADPGGPDPERLQVVAERIRAALRTPLELTRGTFTVGASIGAALAAPVPGLAAREVAEQVLDAADRAMYRAKRAGRDREQPVAAGVLVAGGRPA